MTINTSTLIESQAIMPMTGSAKPQVRFDQQHVAKVFEDTFAEIMHLRKEGQKEYAHNFATPFRNFEKLASDLHMTREQVLWVYLSKHLDGIIAYLNGHRSQRESIHGRIHDCIVYLLLLKSMIVEDEISSNR